MIRVNAISNGQVRGDSYGEGCLGQTGTITQEKCDLDCFLSTTCCRGTSVAVDRLRLGLFGHHRISLDSYRLLRRDQQ